MGLENVAASIDENWFDFVEDWEKVKYPREDGLLSDLLK